jgi:hypothetical protein
MLRQANASFWETNEAMVAGEMSQGQRAAWVLTMAIAGIMMLATLWFCTR